MIPLLLAWQLSAVPMPPPPPSPLVPIVQAQAAPPVPIQDLHSNDGPYANTGTRCYRGETRTGFVHCDCELTCSGDTVLEQPWDATTQTGCQNYCAPRKHPPACACHADSSCEVPNVQDAPR